MSSEIGHFLSPPAPHSSPLGLIAGQGNLPLETARGMPAASSNGYPACQPELRAAAINPFIPSSNSRKVRGIRSKSSRIKRQTHV